MGKKMITITDEIKKSELKVGKRYWFYINNYESKQKSGLFTGKFTTNGDAVIRTKAGEEWSIPTSDLSPSRLK